MSLLLPVLWALALSAVMRYMHLLSRRVTWYHVQALQAGLAGRARVDSYGSCYCNCSRGRLGR